MHAKQPRDLHPRRTVKVQMTAACILMQLRSPGGRELLRSRANAKNRSRVTHACIRLCTRRRYTPIGPRPDVRIVDVSAFFRHRIARSNWQVYRRGKHDFCFLTEENRHGHFVCKGSRSGIASRHRVTPFPTSRYADYGLASRSSLRLCT